MKEFCALRAKAYAYLMEAGSEHKKAKGTKKFVIKRELLFENYEDSLFNDKIIFNDDKRLQTFNKITTYPYGTNATIVCESEMMIVRDFFVKNYADYPFYDEIILRKR